MTTKALAVAAAVIVAVVTGAHVACAQTSQADVALVLAVDVSASIDDERFKLQREGIAAALESSEFAEALASGPNQIVEIAVIEWAEEAQIIVPWTVLRGRVDSYGVAHAVREARRAWVHTMTDTARGITAADQLFSVAPLTSDRKVIDVSGDGQQNTGALKTGDARDIAVSHGVTLNGLPITSGDEPNVDDWYRANVMGGTASFVVVANGFTAFAEAFRQKLTLEVAGLRPEHRLAFLSQGR